MPSKPRFLLWLSVFVLAGFTAAQETGQTGDASLPAPHRMRVSEVVALSLVTQKIPLTYPDAARKAGVEGLVVLKVVIADTGDVKEVTAISGDRLLAQPAAEAVKQWKYKPYVVDGTATEIETQLTLNFHIRATEHDAPALGNFRDGTYSNEFFDFQYLLSRDWVRETQAMRDRLSIDGKAPAMYVLLAAVHIPQQTSPLEADSSFVLSAMTSGGRNCEQYLQDVADGFRSSREAKQKGTTAALVIAGHNFHEADFDFPESPNHRSFLCTESKNYLLQWNIGGASNDAIEATISTLNSMNAFQPTASTPLLEGSKSSPSPAKVKIDHIRVSQGVTRGMVLKKVEPIYPQQARFAHIQGTVIMSAVISKDGDVVDLEVLSGPIELVVSAVNAVRQWKYRPYVFRGEPVEVDTQITVNYTLAGF